MENIEKAPGNDKSNLASNCGQFFTKGPALTKEIITKVQQAELVNKRKLLLGYEFKRRHICFLASIFILFIFSFFGTVVLWCTTSFDDYFLSFLELKNGTKAYRSFTQPDASPYMKVYIFNYTNVEDFEKGRADKLHVKETGPYIFQESTERINEVFGDDGTLTFQEKRAYKFMPELSKGHRQSDQLVVPNLPMLGSVTMVKDTYYMTRVGLSTLIKGLNAKPFLHLPAQKFIWGYDDSFFSIVKSVISFEKDIPFEKFGLLSAKNGTSSDTITVDTGKNGIDAIGKVLRFNGNTRMSHWSTTECNRIDGTLGNSFSPYTIREKKPISIFQKDLCRRLPMIFEEEVKLLDTFSAYRYAPTENVFATPVYEPSNQCFCDLDTGICPPHGIINATPCSFGPVYLSFPHFLYGDPGLQAAVTGLQADKEKHGSFLDIHPIMGYTMQGTTKFQLNVEAGSVFGIPQMDMFDEQPILLPVAWFDSGITVEDLPESLIGIYYQTSITIPHVEIALRYACLLLTAVLFLTMVVIVRSQIRTQRTNRTLPPLQRNISGLDSLIE